MQKAVLIAVVLVAVLVIAWAMWPTDAPEAPAEAAPVEAPAPEPAPETVVPREVQAPPPAAPAPPPEPEVVLPALPDSDPFVLEQFDAGTLPEQWLAQGDYVRRLTVLAENATRGDYPRRQLEFLAPEGPFKVLEQGERKFIDPASYERYDRYVAELEEIEPAELAGLLSTIEPLMQTALAEVGVDAPPGQVLAGAIREVLEVPVLEGDVELVQPNVTYHFADPELESLSPLKKQVLRMGPDNVRRLQTYLRTLAGQLGLDV